MTAQTLPENPSCCVCPAYDLEEEVQQIRLVIEGRAVTSRQRWWP